MDADIEAVEALTALGLTEYEAQCFVALVQLSQGTAKEISRIADVPQSRVYDVTDQLYQKDLVDIEESDPKRYFALPVEAAIERLDREYNQHLEDANDALQNLASRPQDDDGAWTIATRDGVITRVHMHIDDATEEIYLHIGHEELLEPDLLDELGAADDRSLTIYAEVPSETLKQTLHERIPAANVAVSDLSLSEITTGDGSPGRLLMVDRETILLSAQKDGLVPNEVAETGLWGSEVGHGLVAWLRPLLLSRIQQVAFTTTER